MRPRRRRRGGAASRRRRRGDHVTLKLNFYTEPCLVRLDRLLHERDDLFLQRLADGLVRTLDVLEVLQVLVEALQPTLRLLEAVRVALAHFPPRDALLFYYPRPLEDSSISKVVVDPLLYFQTDSLLPVRPGREAPAASPRNLC